MYPPEDGWGEPEINTMVLSADKARELDFRKNIYVATSTVQLKNGQAYNYLNIVSAYETAIAERNTEERLIEFLQENSDDGLETGVSRSDVQTQVSEIDSDDIERLKQFADTVTLQQDQLPVITYKAGNIFILSTT